MLLAIAPGARWISPADALPATTTSLEERARECMGATQAQLTVSPSTVNLGQSTTLTWRATLPKRCAMIQIRLDGLVVPAPGIRTIQPIANRGYELRVAWGSASHALANRSVQVILPQTVTITSSFVKPLLLQALRTPNTTIVVQNHVDMNLNEWNGVVLHDIPIAAGVVLRGGRTSRDAGPRIYTTNRPSVFFEVQGEKVRITGLRIQGPDMGAADGDNNLERGIVIYPPASVEIDHNELSGWSGAAIQVRNGDVPTGFLNPQANRIHDNYIHHNQHVGTHGYGVDIQDGAWASIERNVFDWNRHAIAGDGSDGSGYEANENLVLQHGGLHRWIPFPGFWTHTHQFDMHGQDNCGIRSIFSDTQFNCGTAGHSAFIRRNPFLYTEAEAIQLRGTPQLRPYGMFVESNVFAHGNSDDAVTQNESGLRLGNNLYGVNGSAKLGSCDFDADGIDDTFMATGATWWFSSGGEMHWTFRA